VAESLSIAAIGISAVSLVISVREHRYQVAERHARAQFTLTVRPSNLPLGEGGTITTNATTVYVTLVIEVANTGQKAAGRTTVTAWVPQGIDTLTYRWVDAGGDEISDAPRAAPDGLTTLDLEGTEVPTMRLVRTLEGVSLAGEALYLRVPASVEHQSDSFTPVRVHVHAADDDAEETYSIHIVNA
jgi:hypothetical protein